MVLMENLMVQIPQMETNIEQNHRATILASAWETIQDQVGENGEGVCKKAEIEKIIERCDGDSNVSSLFVVKGLEGLFNCKSPII
jgi:hypothetical protein